MTDFIQESGIIGGDLPTIYINFINLYDRKCQLDIFCYLNVGTKISDFSTLNFKIFQITDSRLSQSLYKEESINLITQEIRSPKIRTLNISFTSFKEVEYETKELKKFIATIVFEKDSNLDHLSYLAFPYISGKNIAEIANNNNKLHFKKSIYTAVERGQIKLFDYEYKIQNKNIMWYGDIRETTYNQNQIQYYTVEYLTNVSSRRLRQIRINNNKVRNFQTPKPVVQQSTVPTPAPAPVETTTQLPSPFINRDSRAIYNEFINSSPRFDAESFNVISNLDQANFKFSVNIKNILKDCFIDKNIINNSLLEYFIKNNSINEKSIKLFKKLVPNRNPSINNINLNQQSTLCTENYRITNNEDTNLRRYELSYDLAFNENINQYRYSVEVIFENSTNMKLVDIIKNLNIGKNNFDNYYNLIKILKNKNYFNIVSGSRDYEYLNINHNYENVKNILTTFEQRWELKILDSRRIQSLYNSDVISSLNTYINYYSIINDLSDSQKNEIKTNLINFISPNSLTIDSLNYFKKLYSDLISAYDKIKIKNRPNSSIITYNQDILKEDLQSVQRVTRKINYLNNDNQTNISLQDLVDRIKLEKERIFPSTIISDNSSYPIETMFSYLSPISFQIGDIRHNILNIQQQSEISPESYEYYLNNIIMQIKNTAFLDKRNQATSLMHTLRDENSSKIELFKKSTSYYAENYGLSIENNVKDFNILNDNQLFEQNTNLINLINKINQTIEFNSNIDLYIPNNVQNLPNHILKAKINNSKFNTYRDAIDYGCLMEIQYTLDNLNWSVLTRNSLLNIVSSDATTFKCKLVEHKYDYNNNLKFNLSEIAELQNIDFFVSIDRSGGLENIRNFIFSV